MVKNLIGKFKKNKMVSMVTMAMMALMALPVAASASPPTNVIDFSQGTGFKFGIMDIINSAWSFVAQFDTYTIFVLALLVVPTLIGFVIWIISKLPKFRKTSS